MNLVNYLRESDLPQIVKDVTSRLAAVPTQVPVGEMTGARACTHYQTANPYHTEVCKFSHHPWHSANDAQLTGWRVHRSWQLWALRYSGPTSALFLVVIENPADDFVLDVINEIWIELQKALEVKRIQREQRRVEEAARQAAIEEERRLIRLENIQTEARRILEGMSDEIEKFNTFAVEKEYAELSNDIHSRLQQSLGIETAVISWASIIRSPSAVLTSVKDAECVVLLVKILWNTYQASKQKLKNKLDKVAKREADVQRLVVEFKSHKMSARQSALSSFYENEVMSSGAVSQSSVASVGDTANQASSSNPASYGMPTATTAASIGTATANSIPADLQSTSYYGFPTSAAPSFSTNNSHATEWASSKKKKSRNIATLRADASLPRVISDVFSRITDVPTKEPVGERMGMKACYHFQDANASHTDSCTFSHHPAHSANNCNLQGWKSHRLWQLWALRYAKPSGSLFLTVFKNPTDSFVREVIEEIWEGVLNFGDEAATSEAQNDSKAKSVRSALSDNGENSIPLGTASPEALSKAKLSAYVKDPSLPGVISEVCSKLVDVPTELPVNERVGMSACYHFQYANPRHVDTCTFSHHPWHSKQDADLPGWRAHRSWQLWALRYADTSSALFYTVIQNPADEFVCSVLNEIKGALQKELIAREAERKLFASHEAGDAKASDPLSSSFYLAEGLDSRSTADSAFDAIRSYVESAEGALASSSLDAGSDAVLSSAVPTEQTSFIGDSMVSTPLVAAASTSLSGIGTACPAVVPPPAIHSDHTATKFSASEEPVDFSHHNFCSVGAASFFSAPEEPVNFTQHDNVLYPSSSLQAPGTDLAAKLAISSSQNSLLLDVDDAHDEGTQSFTKWLSTRCPSVVVESYAQELEEQGYGTADMLPKELNEKGEEELTEVLNESNIVKLPHRRFLLQVWRNKLDASNFVVPPSRLLNAPIRSWINMTLEAAKGASEYEQKLQDFGYETVGLLPWDKGAKEVLEKDLLDAGIKLRVHRNRLLEDWMKIIDNVGDVASRMGVSSGAVAVSSPATNSESRFAFASLSPLSLNGTDAPPGLSISNEGLALAPSHTSVSTSLAGRDILH